MPSYKPGILSEESQHDDEQAARAALREPECNCEGCGRDASRTGQPMFLCANCRDDVTHADTAAHEIRIVAQTMWEHWNELTPAMRVMFHQYLAGYLLKEQREQYRKEVMSKVAKGLTNDATGHEKQEGVEA
jgi:predicted amidophosphoribosyltransferase